MISSPNAYVLAALRKLGAEAYRIDWFGDVRSYGRTGGRLPLVNIVVSRWRGLAKTDEIQHPRRKAAISVPMAFLRLLRIGDIWAGGNYYGSDQTIRREEFLGIEITDGAFDVKPAGFPILSGSGAFYPLPFGQIDAHRGHTGACCVRISLPGRITLIIPCMEMIRFYFGASGALLSRLFSGALASQRLFTSARINPVTGIGNIDLAHGLPGVAATTVGRIAFDSHARRAMHWIVNSGTSAAANRERYYPKTTFPFRGRTDLTAEGRWLEHGDCRVFLAERLIRCTHPFPFKALFYTSQVNLLASRATLRKSANRSPRPPAGDIDRRSSNDIVLAENTVAPALLPCRIDVADHAAVGPFPDLLQKPVRRVRSKRSGFGSKAVSQPLDELAAGEECARSSSRVAEVSTEEEVPAEAIEVFASAFSALADSGAIRARLARIESADIFAMSGMEGFSRTNFLTNASNGHLAEVWYARIEFERMDNGRGLLALVRDHVNQESPSHVALIRHHPAGASDFSLVQRYCSVFAEGQFDQAEYISVAGVLDTAGATNIFRASQFLESTVNAEHDRAQSKKEWP